jgi:hypothetical protein
MSREIVETPGSLSERLRNLADRFSGFTNTVRAREEVREAADQLESRDQRIKEAEALLMDVVPIVIAASGIVKEKQDAMIRRLGAFNRG